jgi:hypothetical protein
VDRWREGMRGSHMTGYESSEDWDGDGLRPGGPGPTGGDVEEVLGRGLHSSVFQLNLSRFGHSSPYLPV